MPRNARLASGGLVQHVPNRGKGPMMLFGNPADYAAFAALLAAPTGGCRWRGYWPIA